MKNHEQMKYVTTSIYPSVNYIFLNYIANYRNFVLQKIAFPWLECFHSPFIDFPLSLIENKCLQYLYIKTYIYKDISLVY